MKRLFLPLIILQLLPLLSKSQEYWGDEFWREQAKKRYAKTLTMAGLYTEFYHNGKIKWQGKCLENGDPDSLWTYYDEEGKKLWEGYYSGKIYIYRNYYDDEQFEQDTNIIGEYLKGKKNGEWQYFSNGELLKSGHYCNDEPCGTWAQYSRECQTYSQRKYAEYDYTTQTKTNYPKFGTTTTEHIDSLGYEPDPDNDFALVGNGSDGSVDLINLDLYAAMHIVSLNSIDSKYRQNGYSSINEPLYFLGMMMGGNEDQTFWGMSIGIMPTISQQMSDSVRLRLNAWRLDLKVGYDFFENAHIDLSPYVGIGYEQLNMRVNEFTNTSDPNLQLGESNYRKYTNPGILVYPGLDFRVNMGNFSLHLDGGYTVDYSGRHWKYNSDYLKGSPKTNFTGWIIQGGIGINVD